MPLARPYLVGIRCSILRSGKRIFCCIFDTNVVGAPRRGARPGRPEGRYVQKQMRQHLLSIGR
jgi:hypothetical protein